MKLSPNRWLRRLGYEIRRVPRAAAPRTPRPPRLAPEEIATLERALKQFAGDQPASSACADAGALRRYLSNRRIAFFHEVVRLCGRYQVPLESKRIADFGSGTGYLLRLIHQAAPTAKLSGYDTFADMMGLARRLCPTAALEVRSLLQVNDPFDVIFCTEILEHLEQPGQALGAMARLVRPGGALVLTVPDGRKDQKKPGRRREDGTAYWGHIHFWSPESWALFLQQELGANHRIECGQMASGQNYGIVFPTRPPD